MHIPAVLFVCTGNICRSPSAEGVFRAMAQAKGLDIRLDSAGTHAYHVGEAPDPRSRAAAKLRGYDISQQRARQITNHDFDDFDYILVMDSGHYATMLAHMPEGARAKLQYMMAYATCGDTQHHHTNPLKSSAHLDVPDPYYGNAQSFEYVLDIIELAAEGFFDRLNSGARPTGPTLDTPTEATHDRDIP